MDQAPLLPVGPMVGDAQDPVPCFEPARELVETTLCK
jgi:hypothetical protein